MIDRIIQAEKNKVFKISMTQNHPCRASLPNSKRTICAMGQSKNCTVHRGPCKVSILSYALDAFVELFCAEHKKQLEASCDAFLYSKTSKKLLLIEMARSKDTHQDQKNFCKIQGYLRFFEEVAKTHSISVRKRPSKVSFLYVYAIEREEKSLCILDTCLTHLALPRPLVVKAMSHCYTIDIMNCTCSQVDTQIQDIFNPLQDF